MLTKHNIEKIAGKVSALCEAEAESPYLKQLRKELRQAENAIENLLKALESGQEADILLERIGQKRADKEIIEAQITKEELAALRLSKSDVRFFLINLKEGNIHDEKYRRMLANTLVNKIYLFDDKMTIYFNAGKRTVEINLAPPGKGAVSRKFLLGKACSTTYSCDAYASVFYCSPRFALRTQGSAPKVFR